MNAQTICAEISTARFVQLSKLKQHGANKLVSVSALSLAVHGSNPVSLNWEFN